ncbi:MAG TPA: hypothetical protein VGI46_03685, partial [Candidatus Acidoferrum sp.]
GDDEMKKSESPLGRVLDNLERHYGERVAVGPSDPYEMIVFVNCGYPATDASCARGYEAVKREVGTKPEEILAAPTAKLARLMRLGGIVPELRAERLRTIAKLVNDEFGGDLKWSLEKLLKDEKNGGERVIPVAKKALMEFPVIGEPGADKILLFSGLVAVAAVPWLVWPCHSESCLAPRIKITPRVIEPHGKQWRHSSRSNLRRANGPIYC